MNQLCLRVFSKSVLTVCLTVCCGLAINAQSVIPDVDSRELYTGHTEGMKFDNTGLVMNANAIELPSDCERITEEQAFTVYLGTAHGTEFPENVYGMSQYEYNVAPCSLVTITIINEDQVRHQWMLHGLPRYLYPQGMFHLEAAGGESQTGSFIVPGDNKTYLVHCDMTAHMEKGMKAQLVVGRGSGDLWSVPGISRGFIIDEINNSLGLLLVVSIGAMTLMAMLFLNKK